MRVLLLAAVATLAMGTISAEARQQSTTRDYTWCQRTKNTGGTPQCSFTSFQQCQASVSGIGGDCVRNPRLAYGSWQRGSNY